MGFADLSKSLRGRKVKYSRIGEPSGSDGADAHDQQDGAPSGGAWTEAHRKTLRLAIAAMALAILGYLILQTV